MGRTPWQGHTAARRPKPGLQGALEQVMSSSHRAGCPAHHGDETRQVSGGLCGCLGTRQLGEAGGQGGPALTWPGGGPAPGPALTPRGEPPCLLTRSPFYYKGHNSRTARCKKYTGWGMSMEAPYPLQVCQPPAPPCFHQQRKLSEPVLLGFYGDFIR